MRGFLGALSLLTRVPARGEAASERAIPWLPVVGALIGGFAGAIFVLLRSPLTAPVAATLAVGAGVALTGALHEDGLADTADGFGAGEDRARTLEIMRDPHHGTYGILALVLGVGARIAAVAALSPAAALAGLVAAHAAGRASSALLLGFAPGVGPPSPGGLGAHFSERATRRNAVAAAMIAAAIALGVLGAAGVAAIAVAAVAAAGIGAVSLRKIGGVTGDVLGAAEQITEIGVLMLAVALGGGVPWWHG